MKNIILILTLLVFYKGFACTCKSKTFTEWQKFERENAELIFVGEVVHIHKSYNTFKIKVIEPLKGNIDNGQILTGKNWLYCHPFVSEKGKWIVYGRLEGEVLKLNMCGISRPFDKPITITGAHTPPHPNSNPKNEKKTVKKYITKALKDLDLELKALRAMRKKKPIP